MGATSPVKSAAGDVAYLVGIVLLILVIGAAASQTGYFNPGSYTPSVCTPNGSGGCTYYHPSTYTPPTYTAASTGGAALGAIILAIVAYYYGKRSVRLEVESSLPTASSANPPPPPT
jgi:hypothetical protein